MIYPFREDLVAGGLISYGTSLPDQYRRAALFVHKIFKGALPADLPVEQPTKFELVLNLPTANPRFDHKSRVHASSRRTR